MIIKFSLAEAETDSPAGYSPSVFQPNDPSYVEDKIVRLQPEASRVPCEYPQELTLQPHYLNEARAKTFPEISVFDPEVIRDLEVSILNEHYEETSTYIEISNIVDSGLGGVVSEFFPEAA